MIGQTISHYEIRDKLGEGGMGVVYKAFDSHLDRVVAVKVLPTEKLADANRKRRFALEAKAASALNHPNIITIYDINSTDEIDFIVMEFVAGRTLDTCIPRRGLRLNEALRYSVQIADALATAHRAGIVHRDLKPGNIMLTEQGLVKVLDFGLAKLIEPIAPSEDAETRTLGPSSEEGAIVGTVSYMSPEQAEGKKVDARSDIFSLGAMLYEMVTGRRAFQGDSKLSTLTAILREEPKPAVQVVEDLPREIDRIIRRCLRKNPERRFQTMADLKVALEELKEESDSGSLGAVPVQPPRYVRRWGWVSALVATVGVLGGSLWFVRSSSKAPEPAVVPVPLITYPGGEAQPSFSPDGNQVVFVWNGEKQDNDHLYVKLIGTAGPPLRLTSDARPDGSPAWSPDGRYIAFLRDIDNGKTAVLLVPALGGPERKISEVYTSRWEVTPLGGPSLSWSPDGNSLVVSDRDSLKNPFSLFLLSIEGGEKRKLTSPPAQIVGDSAPALSPDGRTLAFTRITDAGICDLYFLALSDELKPVGEPRQLTFGASAVAPAWTADGREVIFNNFFGDSGIWRVIVPSPNEQPGEARRLTALGDNIIDSAISRRGQRLAYTHGFYNESIVRIAVSGVGTNSSRVASNAQPLISSTRHDYEAQFSPDGRRIAFVSDRSGTWEIWVCKSDGSNAVQLTSFGGPVVSTPRWSPDGQKIAFDAPAAGEFDIYTVSANGGKVQRMTTHPANDGNPSWSHDGRWIYFDSARTGEQQVFKIPANGGDAIQLTRDGGFAPFESTDGKFLYFTKALLATSLWKIPIEGGQSSKILEGVSSYINLAILDGGVYFVPVNRPRVIQFLSFTTNQIRTVAGLEKPTDQVGGLAVSPDGRWILCSQVDRAGSELMLVEKFH